MSLIEEYQRYMRKQDMLGKTFEFFVDGENIMLTKYIENKEPYRVIKIPDFVTHVTKGVFTAVRQSLKIVWNNNRCTSLDGMFTLYSGKELDLSYMDMSNVSSTVEMFLSCGELENLKIKCDSGSLMQMQGMFLLCDRIEKLDLRGIDTTNVINMRMLFTGCNKLKELRLDNWDTHNVVSMQSMFKNCDTIEAVDISSFDGTNVSNADMMFSWCKQLKEIKLGDFRLSNNKFKKIFDGCKSLDIDKYMNKLIDK